MNVIYLIMGFIFSTISIIGYADELPKHIDEAKITDIKELIIDDEQKEFIKQTFEGIYKSLKGKSSQVPLKVWEDIMAEFDMDKLLDELIPIYDKYLSHHDIKELLACKNSKERQKDFKIKAKFCQKKLKISAIWGHKLVAKIQQKLWDKNINFDIYDELDDYDASAK